MRTSCNCRTLLTILVLAGSLPGCDVQSFDDAAADFSVGSASPPPASPPPAAFGPNFSEIQASVFTPTCATSTCHAGATPGGGVNLDAANSYTMLVGIQSSQDAGFMRVLPGNPDNSYLIQKLEGTASGGVPMPPSGSLPQADIDTIRQWITAGAIDDRTPSSAPIKVSSLSPLPLAVLAAPPAQITAGFDRDLDTSTVNLNTFILMASGGDGTFTDGNETQIASPLISVPVANQRTAIFDLTGVAMADDVYQVALSGTAGVIDPGSRWQRTRWRMGWWVSVRRRHCGRRLRCPVHYHHTAGHRTDAAADPGGRVRTELCDCRMPYGRRRHAAGCDGPVE